MKTNWPDSSVFWKTKQVYVTGGAGFLGSYLVDKLKERGATVFIPKIEDYDLTRLNRARQLRHRATRIFNNPIMKMLGL